MQKHEPGGEFLITNSTGCTLHMVLEGDIIQEGEMVDTGYTHEKIWHKWEGNNEMGLKQ
jgi:hypothetical protein